MSLTPTKARELSHKLAGSDHEQALSVARDIKDPWFRCQALSQVARYWPRVNYSPLITQAVKAADSQTDIYKSVTVSAWPIRACLERENPEKANCLLERYTPAATQIENMGSRSESLFMLFQAAKPFAASLWKPVFCALVEATEPALAWRQGRNIRWAAAMVSRDNPELVLETLHRLSDERTITAINRDLQNRKYAEPRPFFWLR